MLVIKGYERRKGTFDFEGKPITYDNIILHINNDDCPITDFVGVSCEQFKIKVSEIFGIFGCKIEDLSKYLDKPVEFKYSLKNSKPELSKVTILDSPRDDFIFQD